MYASITSQKHVDFFCRIKADPVHAFKNILVYELLDSSEILGHISKTIKGELVAEFRHVALDTTGTGYLFDMEKNALDISVGPCTYTLD